MLGMLVVPKVLWRSQSVHSGSMGDTRGIEDPRSFGCTGGINDARSVGRTGDIGNARSLTNTRGASWYWVYKSYVFWGGCLLLIYGSVQASLFPGDQWKQLILWTWCGELTRLIAIWFDLVLSLVFGLLCISLRTGESACTENSTSDNILVLYTGGKQWRIYGLATWHDNTMENLSRGSKAV